MTYNAIVEDRDAHAGVEVVPFEVGGPQNGNPLAKVVGLFQDDPLFDQFIEDMAAYRREVDAGCVGAAARKDRHKELWK